MIGIPIGLGGVAALAVAMNRQDPGPHHLPHDLLRAGDLVARGDRDRLAVRVQRRLRPRSTRSSRSFGIEGPDWLQNTATVKPAIILMAIWKGLGYSMLLYLAAIQGVPARCTRPPRSTAPTRSSACATSRCRWSVPVTFFLVVTNIIAGSQIFTEINIMTPERRPRVQLRLGRLVHRGARRSSTSRWATRRRWRSSSDCSCSSSP